MSHRNAHLSMVLVFGVMTLLTMGAHPQHYLVCHKRKGTYKKMMVPTPALKGHLKHGDYIWQNESDSLYCEDGIDNDCNSLIDMDEPACLHAVCRATCYTAWVECDDPCWYEVLASCTGGDPECLLGNCPDECMELLAACRDPCQTAYENCLSKCPAAP